MNLPFAEIDLKFCRFATVEGRAWTRFEDGTACANWIPRDAAGAVDQSFADVARSCGFETPEPYLVQHELLHSLVPEMLFDRPGYVVRMMAAGRRCDIAAAKAEELLIHLVSLLIADPATPCPDPRWHDIAERVLDLRRSWAW